MVQEAWSLEPTMKMEWELKRQEGSAESLLDLQAKFRRRADGRK
jgi:hypothetical protein